MKFIQFLQMGCLTAVSVMTGFGQSAQEKLDNQVYYQSFIKESITTMRESVDSTEIKIMLKQMELINDKIGDKLSNIVIPEELQDEFVPTVDTILDTDLESMETDEEDVTLGGDIPSTEDNKINDLFKLKDEEDGGISSKLGRRMKTSFNIQYGLNFLTGDAVANAIGPKGKTWSSWFWDYSIQRRIKLGSATSKTSLILGIGYLKNRFKWQGNTALTVNDTGNPSFYNVENTTDEPKFRVGYLTVPLGLRFKVSKGIYMDLGGYAGYRLFTTQSWEQKIGNETITTKRSSDYELNDFTYGVTFGLKVLQSRYIVRYNLAPLFKDNPSYDYNILMVGFDAELF
jgi:hypothetical protein